MPLSPANYRKTAFTHRRGTAAARPAATDVLAGTIYFSSDTGIIERSTGIVWESYSLPTLTTGSVIFAGVSGELTQDNANLFWDDTNNRLGIKTNVPTVPLDIVNNALTTTLTETLRLANTTVATSGVTRQFSPALIFSGTGWDVDGAVSRTVRAAIYARNLSANIPEPFLSLAFDEGQGGGLIDDIYIGRAIDGGAPDIRFRDGNLIFRNASRGISFVTTPLTDTLDTNFLFSGQLSGSLKLFVFAFASQGYIDIQGNNSGAVAGANPFLNIRGFDPSTTTPMIQMRLRSQSSGTPAAGFGGRLLFQNHSTTTINQDAATIDAIWSVATHASRSCDIVINLVDNATALAEKFRFRSTGLLTFGGITSSQPAIKPNSTVLEVRLADDSDYTNLKAKELVISSGTVMMRSSAAMTDGAAAQAGTLLNAPTVGNPTKWIPFDDNGTTRFIPAW